MKGEGSRKRRKCGEQKAACTNLRAVQSQQLDSKGEESAAEKSKSIKMDRKREGESTSE